MPSDEPLSDRCAAKCRGGGYCENYPVKGAERCRMHGGTNPGGAREGAGAPEGNGNAEKHALRADRSKFYDRLSEERQRSIDRFEAAMIERYIEHHDRDPDPADVKDVFEIAVGYVLRDYARDYLVEQMEESGNPMLEHVEMEQDGKKVEFDKPNDLLDKIDDNRREDRMQRKDKGLEKDPESRLADAAEDEAEGWREFVAAHTD